MSIEIHVFFRGKLPSKPELARAMKELGFPITIPPPKDSLEKQSGFLPMRLNREEAGAEFDVFEGHDNIADIMGDTVSEVDPGFDRCGSFRFGGDENEMVTAICASAALAKLVSGVVLEGESGELMQVDAAIAWAKEVFDEHKPPEKPRRKFRTTAAQIKKALTPLLERHQDLTLMGQWLIVKPVHHMVRCVLIDRTSDANTFVPRWVVMHLFQVLEHITLGWGSWRSPPYLFRPGEGRAWFWSEPQAVVDLRDVIEQDALPKLRSLATIADLMDYLVATHPPDSHVPPTGWWYGQLLFDIALGNLDAGRKSYEDLIRELGTINADDSPSLRRSKELCALYQARDRKGLAALLHEWEEITVKNLKIEHLWERTPFLLELGEGASREDTT